METVGGNEMKDQRATSMSGRLVGAFLASLVAAGVIALTCVALLGFTFGPMSAAVLQRLEMDLVFGTTGASVAAAAVLVARRAARNLDPSPSAVVYSSLAVTVATGALGLAVLYGWVGAVTGLGLFLLAALATLALSLLDWFLSVSHQRRSASVGQATTPSA